MVDDEFLSIRDVMERLGAGVRIAYRLVRTGGFGSRRRGRNRDGVRRSGSCALHGAAGRIAWAAQRQSACLSGAGHVSCFAGFVPEWN